MKLAGSTSDPGVPGVSGQSLSGDGVTGLTFADGQAGVSGVGDQQNAQGVFGQSAFGTGVFGKSGSGRAVLGISDNATAVEGNGVNGAGVWGFSEHSEGVHAECKADGLAAMAAFMTNPSGNGAAVYAENKSNGAGIHAKGIRLAAFFDGPVEINGELRFSNADFAEDFEVAGDCEPGEVMVLTENGNLEHSQTAYDKKAIGILSGAGKFRPGIIMDKQAESPSRRPIALVGKVYCKVDADITPIETGDLLTTSSTIGHAMKAIDPLRAFGAVVGKALQSLSSGKGLIAVLVVLQ